MPPSTSDNIVASALARKKRLSVYAPPKGWTGSKKKRAHPKRHAVNKEKSHEARKKHAEGVAAQKKNNEVMKQYHEAVGAYWRGETANHPTIKLISPAPRRTG